MDRHYRNTVDDPTQIDQFWKLTPEAILGDRKLVVELPAKGSLEWPSKASLKELVWAKPMTHAAGEIGVSDVALRKRCVLLGIPLPPRGHWIRSGAVGGG
jgi:hypothetical protein